jgi:hypothetical protein
MSSFLNSLFFLKPKYLNIQSVLNILRNFMFTKTNHATILTNSPLLIGNEEGIVKVEVGIDNEIVLSNTIQEVNVDRPLENIVIVEPSVIVEPVVIKQEERILPKQSDTLFWCLFIIHFGYPEYIEVDRNYGVKELEMKKQIGDFITKNPHKMKNTNVKLTKIAVQEILSELLTSQKDTSMNCMMAILVFYNINVILVNSAKKVMLEYIANTETSEDSEEIIPTYVLYKDTYNKYTLCSHPLDQSQIEDMKSTMVCLESYNKPLKAASHYKVEDLEDMAKKLGIFDMKKKYKKVDLYNEVNNACEWN